MREYDRNRMLAPPSLVNEMDIESVHIGAEMRKPVEDLFLSLPVETSLPIAGEIAKVRSVCPVLPTALDFRIGPSCATQTSLKIIERSLRNGNNERLFHR